MVCKKLVEEDQNGNEALLLLRSEKYTTVFENIKKEFQRRFCDFHSHESEFVLFSDPFHCDPESAPTNMQVELIELQESSDLKSSFRDLPLDKFYSLVQPQSIQLCASTPPEWLLFLKALTFVRRHFQS